MMVLIKMFAFLLIILIHCVTSSNYGLNGMNLRILAVHIPPQDILQRQPDGNFTISSSNVEVWQWLAKKINFTITMIPLTDKVLITRLGIYEAAISVLANQDVDSIATVFSVTPERNARFDYTSLVWSEPYNLVVPKPEIETRLFAFLLPFQPMVWYLLVLSALVFIGTTTWFSRIYNKKFNINPMGYRKCKENPNRLDNPPSPIMSIGNSVSMYTIYVVNILTNHGSTNPYAEHSFRILAACWLLTSLVLVNSYSSIIVSSLTVPIMKPAVNSFQDLVDNKQVSLVLRPDIVVGQQIMNASGGVLKTLADELRQHPDRLFLENDSLLKKLSEGRYAYPFISSFNRFFVSQKFKEEGKCRFQTSDPLYEITGGVFVFLMDKNFTYTAALRLGTTRLLETGLVLHWKLQRVSLNKAEQCLLKHEKPKANKPVAIRLKDLTSAFFVLGIGIGLAIASFLIELIIGIGK